MSVFAWALAVGIATALACSSGETLAEFQCGGCPVGFECDGHSLCVPATTCTAQTCPADQYCALGGWNLSKGICVPLSALQQQPPPAGCPWPFVQRGGTCGVPCGYVPDARATEGCPPGLTCTNGFCN